MTRHPSLPAAFVFLLVASPSFAADPPKVKSLRTQKVDQTTYFHVRFENPSDLRMPTLAGGTDWLRIGPSQFNRVPRLVPQDGGACCVYLRMQATPGDAPRAVPVGQ